MWRCDACGREFANLHQSHACGTYDLQSNFSKSSPEIRTIFNAVCRALKAIGPVRVLPQKTRIAFQVRMSFAQVTPRRNWLDGHVVLARVRRSRRFRRVEVFSPRNVVHHFRLTSVDDVDDEFRSWLAEAYAVGEQRHLNTRNRGPQTADRRSKSRLRQSYGAPGRG